MKLYARVINEKTKECAIGIGTNEAYFRSIDMKLMDVEQGFDGKWYLEGFAQNIPLPQLRARKLSEVNKLYEDKARAVKADTPDSETQTWYIQEAEAEAWRKDSAAPTPFINALAAARQIPRDLLLQKVLEKVALFKEITGKLTGLRQFYEDKINAAQNIEELEGLTYELFN